MCPDMLKFLMSNDRNISVSQIQTDRDTALENFLSQMTENKNEAISVQFIPHRWYFNIVQD